MSNSIVLPKMKNLRLDITSTSNGDLCLLVDQLTEKIYYANSFSSCNGKLKNLYSDFKYRGEQMGSLNFWVPCGLAQHVCKINNINYSGF
tara:strand:- start:354 stop:623 length:270 start_codon:yes stop_codon:yes gene_type:complete